MNLRTRFERFCYNNRDKGIPNLMLYIAIGNAIVLLLSFFNGGAHLYNLLCFDKNKILQGQVWRLITYVFTQSGTGLISLIFLYFFYMLGRHTEQSMGTFKFNLFYLSGVILMDIYAMIFCPMIPETITTQAEYELLSATVPMYQNMAYYLHLSLLLTFATMHPDSHFLIMFIIPVKGWIIALFDLVLTLAEVFNLSFPVFYFPHNLFPFVAIGNYLLFFGRDIGNLIPLSWRRRAQKPSRKKAQPQTGSVPFKKTQKQAQAADYTHRCTICGRTDVSNPELEFRYCSRCNGYFCYCQDHINNHTHVE